MMETIAAAFWEGLLRPLTVNHRAKERDENQQHSQTQNINGVPPLAQHVFGLWEEVGVGHRDEYSNSTQKG